MKPPKIKKFPGKKEHFQIDKTLRHLTVGKNDSMERILVRQALRSREEFPESESRYKDWVFQRIVNRDANFLRIVIQEIEFMEGGTAEANPQAAAVVRGWMVLWEKNWVFSNSK